MLLHDSRYDERRPDQTVLYQVVARHLATFLEMTAEVGSLPAFVQRDLERFLACGIHAHGFARIRCEDCGHSVALPFSCKGRTCVSCRTRQMEETAAHLLDRVLPAVPIRHCVLTLPIPLRLFLARDQETLGEVLRCFIRVLSDWFRDKAGIAPSEDSPAEIGAVTRIHRAGSSLALNVHFHVLVTSGVFVPSAANPGESGALEFVPVDQVDRHEILELETAVVGAIVRLLEKRGVLAEGQITLEADLDQDGALHRCRIAAATGRRAFGPDAGGPLEVEGGSDLGSGARSRRRSHGFDLYLGQAIQDRTRLRRLCQYIARPSVADDQLSWREDGRVRLEFKRPWANGTSAVILEPLELLARLAALVPRPFANQTRYHGVLAPNAAWRHLVVPIGGRSIPRRRKERSSGGIWTSWAELLRRTYAIDVLACPRCGGRREVIAVISNPETASGILESLGLPTEPPEIAPSWWGSAREIWN